MVKAHGDGAMQIAVEGLNYCPKSHCLASVAERAGSVHLWDISDEGDFDFATLTGANV